MKLEQELRLICDVEERLIEPDLKLLNTRTLLNYPRVHTYTG